MLTKEELEFAADAIRSMRFMMASAIVAIDLQRDHKHARKYMQKLADLNTKLDEEVECQDQSVGTAAKN